MRRRMLYIYFFFQGIDQYYVEYYVVYYVEKVNI